MKRKSLRPLWTVDDDKALRAMVARGVSRPSMARHLKRTPNAVTTRMKKLGIDALTRSSALSRALHHSTYEGLSE
jgi:hypothetical protein